ncbi:hypothetical protein FEM48_Zijuj05G0056800 [Ziziphus jujuba var. spinosa]|uniref:Uncharacterized protein n=1 Tax=Ziziphus jujuba var. spinosa TaxID=714518 RepID=A0A978VD50_ZIZJJ|nr:hypothetical protein FEM48_Zijuj05G0056800 [Ziziphus jujuba var. spinosa]
MENCKPCALYQISPRSEFDSKHVCFLCMVIKCVMQVHKDFLELSWVSLIPSPSCVLHFLICGDAFQYLLNRMPSDLYCRLLADFCDNLLTCIV